MVKNISTKKLNATNRDIWSLLEVALKTKNFALLERNFRRLYSLQSHYVEMINRKEHEIRELNIEVAAAKSLAHQFERDWFEEAAKRTGTYDRVKQDIDEIFGK